MEDQLILIPTAKLAKEKGFDVETDKLWVNYYAGQPLNKWKLINKKDCSISFMEFYAPTKSILQKWIRENRGVHIVIERSASGWFWQMCKSDGGTDLGWSDYSGPNMGGVWDSFEDALENALQVQLLTDLGKFGHWGCYARLAIDKSQGKEQPIKQP